MALFSLIDVQLSFGHLPLLDHVEFSIERGERVGLIGRNGTGKSSLLRIIDGRIQADDGQIAKQSGLRIVTVEQEPQFTETDTVFDAVLGGMSESRDLLKRYQQLSTALASPLEPDRHEALLSELTQVQHELDIQQAWSLHAKVDTTLSKLSLSPDQIIAHLSGGTRKRVALARALLCDPDILLLDEPTNHLDLDAITWLEDLLKNFIGSVVFITHDRHFLDHIATRIVELDRGKLASFPGSYTQYLSRKAELLEAERLENERFDKLLAQEEVWIRKGVEARRTRSVGRVKRLESLRKARTERREQIGKAKIDVAEGMRSGKLVAELMDVSKGYDGRTLINGYSTTIMRGDHVGIIGPNGVGKTTLLRIILGVESPDQGAVRLGTNVTVAYFDQMRDQLDPNKTLADVISPGSEWIEINGERKHVMSYLGDFLFSPERARALVRTLSGGERARLLLARLFARPANVLVLDEPTNDLDIETIELIEDLLQDYPGTVFLVSHDRSFLDNVATQTIAYEGDGGWRDYVGGYQDWLDQRPQVSLEPKVEAKAKVIDPPQSKQKNTIKQGRLSRWEEKELAEIPSQIESLESEQASINERLADGSLYVSDLALAQSLSARLLEIDDELLVKLERWEVLDARQ